MDAAQPIKVTVRIGDAVREVSIPYHGGKKYPILERNANAHDLLSDLLDPLTK